MTFGSLMERFVERKNFRNVFASHLIRDVFMCFCLISLMRIGSSSDTKIPSSSESYTSNNNVSTKSTSTLPTAFQHQSDMISLHHWFNERGELKNISEKKSERQFDDEESEEDDGILRMQRRTRPKYTRKYSDDHHSSYYDPRDEYSDSYYSNVQSSPSYHSEDDYGPARRRRGPNSGSYHGVPPSISLPPGIAVKRKTTGGSIFVPVAAYSVTKSKPKHGLDDRNGQGMKKRQGIAHLKRKHADMSSAESGKHTESAVYGYMQKPEIIEFRGQYFYGNGQRPGEPGYQSSSSEHSHSPPVFPWDLGGAGSSAQASFPDDGGYPGPGFGGGGLGGYGGGLGFKKGHLGPGGLLLATLPLILAPMLSYLFTPMIIPITATVAAGRRRRDTLDALNALNSSNTASLLYLHEHEHAYDANLAPTPVYTGTNNARNKDYHNNHNHDKDHHKPPRFKQALNDIAASASSPHRRIDKSQNLTSNSFIKSKSYNDEKDEPQTSESIRNKKWDQSSDFGKTLDDPRYREAQLVAEYLRKVHFDEKLTTRAIANYLQCDGMLADEDHCIERLACEFSDPNNRDAPELDRAVTSILLGHILSNGYITDSFKIKLKLAAVFGRDHTGGCNQRYVCNKVVAVSGNGSEG